MLTFLMSITKDEHKHILWHIYENYRNDMYHAAKSVIHDVNLAEDVVQVSFERIIKKMHLIEKIPRNDLRGYIVLLVKNIAINTSIKEDKYKLIPDEDMEMLIGLDNTTLEDTAILNEQIRIIKMCLNQMDEKYVLPMLLRYYYGFSDSETGQLLGINSANTVRSLCHRGKNKIIEAMKKAGNIDD